MADEKTAPKNKRKSKKNIILVIVTVIVIGIFLFAGVFIEVSNQKKDYTIKPANEKMLSVESNQFLESLSKSIQPDQKVPFSQAQFYFKSSDFKSAYQALLPYALEGNSIAQLEIGFLTEFGLGVKKNTQAAALWYFIAAKPNAYNEHAFAWGVDYYFGLAGKEKDMDKAALWFRMAAELSNDRY
ncbi:hypothetical protein L3V83_02215 [Thiotrichales bacterium 19X7-9]|nr:hypothetical protein [Thiotrichales bacterium 19X7-9]